MNEDHRVRRPIAVRFVAAAVLPLSVATAVPAHAQGAPQPVRALEVGARAGMDIRNEAPLLGVQLRMPVDPWLRLDLVPGAELVFQSGFTERQYNLDGALYLDAGRSLYVGGGAAFLDTFYLDEDGELLEEREIRSGYSVFGGFHGTAAPGGFAPHIELRWTYVDVFELRTIYIGVNYFLRPGS